jgi:hypothetical protein
VRKEDFTHTHKGERGIFSCESKRKAIYVGGIKAFGTLR